MGRSTALRAFLNLASDDDFNLAVAWLLAALRPTGPYPVLVLTGEQGSAKSTCARMLRALVDPHEAALRAPPRNEHELFIAARNAHVLAFDNLSTVLAWLSDALCRLSTGAGFAARKLYTDDEESVISAERPVLLNSIDAVVTRGDLADRATRADARGHPGYSTASGNPFCGPTSSERARKSSLPCSMRWWWG